MKFWSRKNRIWHIYNRTNVEHIFWRISFLKKNQLKSKTFIDYLMKYDFTYVSKWFGFQTKSIDLISIFDCEPNQIDCQEIKSLIFRFDSISFDLKSIEIEISKKRIKKKTFQNFFFLDNHVKVQSQNVE